MTEELMRRLRVITPEEQRILDGGAVDKAAYTARAVFTVDSEKLFGARAAHLRARTHAVCTVPQTRAQLY